MITIHDYHDYHNDYRDDYHQVATYSLTLLVRNAPYLEAEAQLIVNVIDENDLAPSFDKIKSGSVLENKPPGTKVSDA